MDRQTHGLVIGRFMPPHNGHRYLIDFAAAYADRVTVFVCTLSHEPIAGDLRYRWMNEIFPSPRIRIVHITEEIPEASRHNPDSPRIWALALLPHLDRPVDFLFASEDYGQPLAQAFAAQFVAVDPARNAIGTSATQIRQNPIKNWKYLPLPVRQYFVQLVVIVPPTDSTPEQTLALAARVATELDTVFLPATRADKVGVAQLKALFSQTRGYLVLTKAQEAEFSSILNTDSAILPRKSTEIPLPSLSTATIREYLVPFLEELNG